MWKLRRDLERLPPSRTERCERVAINHMWFAAIVGRLAYFTHRASGHAVTWKSAAPERAICPGDIVCDDCAQVLWCRAHDPWRVAPSNVIPDHWGATRARRPRRALFESLQSVLQLADECPRSPSGDAVRRAACELVEADSTRQRRVRRRRMLRAVARLERSHERQRDRNDGPSLLLLKRLADALRDELRPELDAYTRKGPATGA